MALHELSASTGGWTNYTPQVDQGVTTNIAKTINVARYVIVGNLCYVHVNLSFTGTGTSGSNITVTTPVPDLAGFTHSTKGTGIYNDAGVLYRLLVGLVTSTTMGFFAASVTANSYLGNNPALAIASGDTLGFTAALDIYA